MSTVLRHAAVLASLALVSCGFGKKDGKEEVNPFGPTGIPPELRSRAPEGTAVTPGGNTPGSLAAAITPEEDMVFTDPDNPDAGIPELSEVLKSSKKGPWEDNFGVARRRAYREGKPLMIFFTDSRSNPMAKALDDELFARHDFGGWAGEKLVMFRVDVNEKVESESLRDQEDQRIRTKNEAMDLKKRYNVLGHPTVVMVSPAGEVVGRYRGYKRGQADFTWGQLKHSEAVASNSNQEWRKGLEKKGYREWQDTKGRKVFAKLVSYHKGDLILVEPDGLRSKTRESRLSDADKSWIRHQKEIRGID